jgi:hypothetical protein
VRQKLYKHSVGGWRAYGEQIKPIIDEFQKYLPYLRKKNLLPSVRSMNWQMDKDFSYDDDNNSNVVEDNSAYVGNDGRATGKVPSISSYFKSR